MANTKGRRLSTQIEDKRNEAPVIDSWGEALESTYKPWNNPSFFVNIDPNIVSDPTVIGTPGMRPNPPEVFHEIERRKWIKEFGSKDIIRELSKSDKLRTKEPPIDYSPDWDWDGRLYNFIPAQLSTQVFSEKTLGVSGSDKGQINRPKPANDNKLGTIKIK